MDISRTLRVVLWPFALLFLLLANGYAAPANLPPGLAKGPADSPATIADQAAFVAPVAVQPILQAESQEATVFAVGISGAIGPKLPVKALARAGKLKRCSVVDDGMYLSAFHSDSAARNNVMKAYQQQVSECIKAMATNTM